MAADDRWPEASRLRALVPGDLDAIAGLEAGAFGRGAWSRAMLAEELCAPGRHYVGIDAADGSDGSEAPERSGGLIGYAGINLGCTSAVMTIAVRAESRGLGWGATLLTDLLDAARAAGSREVILEVRADAPTPQRLYRRFGFVELGIRKNYYQLEGADALVMRLPLRETIGPIGSEVLE